MPRSEAEAVALLKWVNTFPGPEVKSLADLIDGTVLSRMLGDLDPAYAIHDLEPITPSSKWLARKSNLEKIYKSLSRFIHIQCGNLDPVALRDPVDINAIAQHGDAAQNVKLLTIFLLAAVHSTNKERCIERIQTLDTDSQGEIAAIIQKIQTESDNTELKGIDDGLPPKINEDLELAREEEHAKLHAAHTDLKKRHADFITRFDSLQESHSQLLEHSRDVEDRLNARQGSTDDDTEALIEDLRAQLQEANDLIANQEQQAETDRITKERLQRELDTRPSAERAIEFQDKLKELQTENTTLTRKANTLDHYQKKLENLQGIERTNAHLREQIETMEINLKDFDQVNEDNEKLNQTLREVRMLLGNIETENATVIQSNKRLGEEIRSRDDRIRLLEERQVHDENYISEMKEQYSSMTTLDALSSPTDGPGRLNLEQELEQSGDPAPNYALEISRLRAENQILKSAGGGSTVANLRIDLEESERKRKRLQENVQELTEKHAIAQQQLSAALSNSKDQKDVAFSNLQKNYMQITAELDSTKLKRKEIQSKLSQTERDYSEAKSDLEAMNRDELDALETLKETNEIVTSSLQHDLSVLQNEHRNLTTDHESQQKHLIEALLTKEQLMKDLADTKERGGTTGGNTASDDDKLKSTEQIQKLESVVQDLQRRLKTTDENSPEAQKAANDSMIKNLTRENALIATAWYDLTSRMQSNIVVLQRRQDAPRAWLNKQRQMVNSTPRR